METGEVIHGRFRIVEPLRLGGMACVWTAVDIDTGRLVALKMLKSDQYHLGWAGRRESAQRRTELLKRFEREGRLLEELDHPGIPKLLHRGHRRGDPYLVMEYIDGVPLDDFLARYRPVPLGAAISIAVQLAEALSCAHAAGIVHRDLKPANVVLDAEGAVSLIDFGIAYLTGPDATRYTVLGATPGSAGYMAPEQIRGQQIVTTAVDRYSFGCVLFELLTGRQPFSDQPDRSRDMQHLEDLPPRVIDFKPNVPAELDDLTWRLLNKDPVTRPADIAEALQILRAHLPALGAPLPNPELVPDPTARYRSPGRAIEPAGQMRPRANVRAGTLARRPRARLARSKFDELARLAEAELAMAGPGPAAGRLTDVLGEARDAWGLGDLSVSRAQVLSADAARLDGDWERAGVLYRAVGNALEHRSAPELRAVVLEARVGAAECRVPARDVQGAFDGWADVVHELSGLVKPPGRVVARCREVALELEESGRQEQVRSFLRLLPDS
ncbi:serine/threonine-protein kinase [Kitasatospora sp. NPDC007106]|uniref:serine/threonine-protein kinase n=1 Tax=Kitasatospora sp. NPDC007106 TaxID=3156914 RepID=UPI0034117BE3